MPGFDFPARMDAGVLGCGAYWEPLRFRVPALPLASCGISGRPLPSTVPRCSYLQNEGTGLVAPRQLQYVMSLRFKCVRSGGETRGESMKPRKNVARLGNEIRRSRERWGKTNPENELGELEEKSPLQWETSVHGGSLCV